MSIDRSSGIAAFCTANHCVQLYNLISDHEISEVSILKGLLSFVSDSCMVLLFNKPNICRFKFAREIIIQTIMKSGLVHFVSSL